MRQVQYIEHADGLITNDIWRYSLSVIQYDASSSEFGMTWAAIGHICVPAFRSFSKGLSRIAKRHSSNTTRTVPAARR